MAVATLGWGLGYWKTALNAERQMQLLLLLASVLPAKTFGQHLRKKRKKQKLFCEKGGVSTPELGEKLWKTGWKWDGSEDCPVTSRIQINSVRNFSSSAGGTCFASFGWRFACTRQPSTANSCWLQPACLPAFFFTFHLTTPQPLLFFFYCPAFIPLERAFETIRPGNECKRRRHSAP